ncbi:hypothetical protein OROGR_015331 [Orobanche gracilis]
MSLVLSPIRSHLFKHLTSCNSATTFFSFRRRISRAPPSRCFSSSPLAKADQQQSQLSRLDITTINYSTQPVSNGTVVTDDSLTSPYLSVRICCPIRVSDVLSESLLCFGASSTTVDERDIHETGGKLTRIMSEPLAEGRELNGLWFTSSCIWISSIFNVDHDVKDCISRAADSVGLKELPDYRVEMHDHTDWIKLTQESFHPAKIKEGLWVVPEWRNPPLFLCILVLFYNKWYEGSVVYEYDGVTLEFTGSSCNKHYFESWFGIWNWGTPYNKVVFIIAAWINKRRRILSGLWYRIGCSRNSSTKDFGAELSVGFDIEPQAITSAQHNAALNDICPDKLLLSFVPSKNESGCPLEDISSHGSYNSKIIAEKDKYDVVIANILLYPLLDLAEQIVSYGKPGAIIGVSGIISEQVSTVIKHYSQFLEDINVTMMDDWACISGTKRTEPKH